MHPNCAMHCRLLQGLFFYCNSELLILYCCNHAFLHVCADLFSWSAEVSAESEGFSLGHELHNGRTSQSRQVRNPLAPGGKYHNGVPTHCQKPEFDATVLQTIPAPD